MIFLGLKFQHFLIFNFFWDFLEIISILEVEIGRNGPGILEVKVYFLTKKYKFFFE
jgi:hypothetical protein